MAQPHSDESAVRLKRKRELYDTLDSFLHDENDDSPDLGRQSSEKALQNGRARKKSRVEQQCGSKSSPASMDGQSLQTRSDRSTSTILVQSMSSPTPPKISHAATSTLRRAVSAVSDPTPARALVSAPSVTAGIKKSGKKKIKGTFNMVPEEQQIFKGLHFYFFPNTDTHPARRIRIAKAQQYGATWVREWSETITHIIMDKGMDFSLMLKWIKLDSPPSNIAVVSEIYPAECISSRALLDPTHFQFRVKGFEQKPAQGPTSASSATSLELKPPKKDVVVRREETQNRIQRTPSPLSTASTDDDECRHNPPLPTRIIPSSEQVVPSGPVQTSVELDAAIQQARALRSIPLDDDDAANSRPSSSSGSDEEPKSGLELLGQKQTKFQQMQEKFQCMQKHTGERSDGPNAATIAILQQMADYYGQIADEWRFRAYRKAISVLRNHPQRVQTKAEALALPQVGERLAAKIEEIAVTNRLRRLDNALAEPGDQILQTFMKVYGAGLAQASKWVNAGYKTLDELLEKADLTANQRIGIKHFEDFNSQIPRSEVEQHGAVVKKELLKIDPTFEVIVGGSYRRGASTSGDIDCLITRRDTALPHIRAVAFQQLVPKLKAKGFLVAELAVSSIHNDGTKWHGACALPLQDPPVWRRIDILLVPSDELGAALIYWTGNDIFNRSLRLLASKKNMRLNQKGLFEGVVRGKGREKLNEGTLVEGRDEKKIFEILGVPWRPPEHRIC